MQFVWNKITNKFIYSTKEEVLLSLQFSSLISIHIKLKIHQDFRLFLYNVVSFVQLPLDLKYTLIHTQMCMHQHKLLRYFTLYKIGGGLMVCRFDYIYWDGSPFPWRWFDLDILFCVPSFLHNKPNRACT